MRRKNFKTFIAILIVPLLMLYAVSTANFIGYEFNKNFIADSFDFPVGAPNAHKYYDAQPFGKNHHLGNDWNGRGGGNSDLNDPIYSIANGYVTSVKNHGGSWGKVIRVMHVLPDGTKIESLYAHCKTINVYRWTYVRKGQQIATIGNNKGQYLAHLHFELRDNVGQSLGKGYSRNKKGYLNPTKFIRANRK